MQPIQPPPHTPGTPGEEINRQADDLKQKTDEVKQEAKENATRAYRDVKDGARQAVRDSASYAKDVAAGQKSALVSKLDEYKGAMLAASDKLDAEDDSIAAGKIRKAARGIDNVSAYLRETDPSELFDEASRLARKHPELVFGGMFLTGLGIARFLKSSAAERRKDSNGSSEQARPPRGLPQPGSTVPQFHNSPAS